MTPPTSPSSTRPTVSVLADDLTGATDTVVQFRVAGWSAYLLLSDHLPEEVQAPTTGVALARSLDSRHLSDQEAAAVTERAVVEQVAAGVERLYVKMDSTVRGSVTGQVAGALTGWRTKHPEAVAVICPAYPRMGRTVVDGRVLVNGVPLDQSEAGFDPVTPVQTAELAALIGEAVAVGTAPTAAELADRITHAALEGASRVIVDAADDADLERLTHAVDMVDGAIVCVGSAGWARHLADVWLATPAVPTVTPSAPDGPVVVCVSSLNEVALDQAEHLCATLGGQVLRQHVAPTGATVGPDERQSSESAQTPQVVLLQPAPKRVVGADQAAVARRIALRLAETVGRWVGAGDVAGAVLVGGDGAEATLGHLGASALQVDGRASEGVPLGRVVGGPAAGLVVATKAGGFGSSSTLTDVVTAMLNTKENES